MYIMSSLVRVLCAAILTAPQLPAMTIYTQYVNNFSWAMDQLEMERAKSKPIAAFLKSCEESNPLGLNVLLSSPLNRIGQYQFAFEV